MKRYLGPVRSALPEFIAKLQPNDTVALITFDDDVHVEAPFGAPRDQLAARIGNSATVGSKTLLHKALDQSLTMLKGARRSNETTHAGHLRWFRRELRESIRHRRHHQASRQVERGDRHHLAGTARCCPTRYARSLCRAQRWYSQGRDQTRRAQADVKAALNDINNIATNAVIASFERQIQNDANTREDRREPCSSWNRRGHRAFAGTSVGCPRPSREPPNPPSQVVTGSFAGQSDCYRRCLPRYGCVRAALPGCQERNPNRRLLNPIPWVVIQRRPLRWTSHRQAAGITEAVTVSSGHDGRTGKTRRRVPADRTRPGTGCGRRSAAWSANRRGRPALPNRRRQQQRTSDHDRQVSIWHACPDRALAGPVDADRPGSSNGTFVNGRRLTGGQAHPLHNGESVRIGTSEFRIMLAPVAAAAAAAPRRTVSQLPRRRVTSGLGNTV